MVDFPPLTPGERKLKKLIQRAWEAQEAKVLARAPQYLKSMGNAEQKVIGIPEGLMTLEFLKESETLMQTFFAAGSKEGAQQIEQDFDAAFPTRPENRRWVKKHTLKFARSVDDTTATKLKATIKDARERGLTTDELRKEIQAIYSGWDKKKAEMIARTEEARATHLAQERYWKESGLVKAKVWDALNDSCAWCQEMHGRVVAIGKPYFERGDALTVMGPNEREATLKFDYDEVMAPPLHPHCRCTIRPVMYD